MRTPVLIANPGDDFTTEAQSYRREDTESFEGERYVPY
jgi:hypothetical protein